MLQCKLKKARSRAASEVSTEDWSVLIPGNVETFVGYDQTETEVKITRIRKVDSKKRRSFVPNRIRQYAILSRRWRTSGRQGNTSFRKRDDRNHRH